MSRNHFMGWLHDWQELPLSVTHPDYFEGARVIAGKDDDGNHVVTAPIVKYSTSGLSVQTKDHRWRLRPGR